MDKKYRHRLWTRIRPIKPWYLIVLCLVSVAFCVAGLRNNYRTMTQLRADVYKADQTGVDVEGALQRLRAYVNAHMNTNLASGNDSVYPPIQLKYTYERLQQAANQTANSANTQVYTDAQHHCEQLYPNSVSGGPRVPCIEAYVTQHGVAIPVIPDSLYKFNFSSPSWSPDMAGWGMVAAVVFLLLALIRIVLRKLLT